jgi:hypothetical protein
MPLGTRITAHKFTLVVDDFGVHYVGDEHANHLINALKKS